MIFKKFIQSQTFSRWTAIALCYAMLLTGAGPAWAGEVCSESDLADVPLELVNSVIKVPSIFMITLDNSDTMDYGVMTNENTDTKMFTIGGTSYGYVLNGSYATGAAILENSAAHRNAWKARYCKTNKMFFNPEVTYNPWPADRVSYRANSNIDTPRWDPRTPRGDGSGTYNVTLPWGGAGAPGIGYTDPSYVPPADPVVMANASGAVRTVPAGCASCAWKQSTFVPPEAPFDLTWYYYTDSGGANIPNVDGLYFSVTWTKTTAQGINPATPYDVFVRYPDPCAANKVSYKIYDNATLKHTKGPNFNQDTVTDAKWVKINDTPITFSSGTAKVVMQDDETLTKKNPVGCSATNKPIYHAQLKFVPCPVTPVLTYNLTRRHFYMTGPDTGNDLSNPLNDADSEPDIYLIDINDVSTAHFFKLIDANANGIGDSGEYRLLTYDQLPDADASGNAAKGIKDIIPAPAANAYEDLCQNFANWVTYHSRRMWAAVNAVGIMITTMENMLVGMQTSPPSSLEGKTGTLFINTNFNNTHYDMTAQFLAVLYNIPDCHSNRGFSEDLTDMGDFIEKVGGTIANNNDKEIFTSLPDPPDPKGPYCTTSASGSYPYFTEAWGGSCQHAFALVITDGASPSTANIKNYDGDPGEFNSNYDGGIFGDSFTKTTADAAMQYYERDLKSNLSNNVPQNEIDQATHQHMVTYGLSFGVNGPLFRADPAIAAGGKEPSFNALCADSPPANTCKSGCTCPTWGDPLDKTNPMSVLDDLWHATVNGRGKFFYADNPQELVDQLALVAADIQRRTGTAAAVTTNSVQRQVGTMIYQGLYNSETWWGDLVAKSVDLASGAISGQVWSARDQLTARDYTSRKVFTSVAGSPMDFNAGNAASFGLTADQVNYLLGDDSKETQNSGIFRSRIFENENKVNQHSKLGDIGHSEPYYFDGVVYVGANDGMLHAFNADTGNELFAYVPNAVYNNLSRLCEPDFVDNHKFFVDASPYVYQFATTEPAYLVCGYGKGAKGLFSLRVNNAKKSDVSAGDIFNWEFSDPLDSNLGYIYGRAYVAKTAANIGPVVIFGNGYASDDQKAVLYILNAASGAVVRVFDTGRTGTGLSGCNGMSSPAIIDYNSDNIIDYVYAGDLDGNLWKFDLRSSNPDNWSISYGGNPLFTARDVSGAAPVIQPITTEPDAMKHCDIFRAGIIVVFGTGQYLGPADLAGQSARQAIYGIYDWELDLIESHIADASTVTQYYLGSLESGGALSNVELPAGQPAKILFQTVTADVDIFRQTSNNPINYFNPYVASQTGQTHVGWCFLMPAGSERMVRRPLIRNGVVYAVANTITTNFCSGTGGGFVYALDACSGGRPYKPQFDVNGDGIIDNNDLVDFGGGPTTVSGMYFGTTLFDPLAMEDHLYIPDTLGNILVEPIPPNPPGMRYWRIIE